MNADFYNKICLFLPTYKRVADGRLPKFVRSAIETCYDLKNICFSFLVNWDDIETLTYLKQLRETEHDDVSMAPRKIEMETIYTHTDPPSLAKFYNEIYRQTRYCEESTLVSMVGDDMVFLTPGWDKKILDKINEVNGVGMVYCDDDYVQHEKLCVNMFTTRKLVEATGRPFMCELFPVDFLDNIWQDLASGLGIAYYLGDVKIKHEHANQTATFQRLRQQYGESHKNVHMLDAYVSEMGMNVRKSGILG